MKADRSWARLGALMALCLGEPASATAQTYAPACSLPANRALDFWLGEWTVDWSTRDGRSGRADSSITLENGGCVVRERFRDRNGGLEGTGLYSYFAPIGAWTQTWMDNQGVTLSSTGGLSQNPGERFTLRLGRGPNPAKHYRTVWENGTSASFIWRFQTRGSDSEPWSDEGVSRYTRK